MMSSWSAKSWGRLVLATILLGVWPSTSLAALFPKHRSLEEVQAKISRLPTGVRSRTRGILTSDLGTLLYRKGDYAEASKAFEESLLNPTRRSLKRHIYRFLGKSYESSGRIDKAIDAYEQAVRYDKSNWRRYRDLGVLYEEMRLTNKAVEMYSQAIKLGPREASLYWNRGRTRRKMSLYEKAEPDLKKALTLDPKSSAIKRELSFIYEGKGQFGLAASYWEKTLNGASTIPDVGRIVYLSALAQDFGRTRQGLEQLKALGADAETVDFYQFVVKAAGETMRPWETLEANANFKKRAEDLLGQRAHP